MPANPEASTLLYCLFQLFRNLFACYSLPALRATGSFCTVLDEISKLPAQDAPVHSAAQSGLLSHFRERKGCYSIVNKQFRKNEELPLDQPPATLAA